MAGAAHAHGSAVLTQTSSMKEPQSTLSTSSPPHFLQPFNPSPMASPKKILFIHPDLGIGGAERLVVDAAVGLQDRGHSVTVYTSHCEPRHCFDEARNGASILSSRVLARADCL